MAGSPGWPLPPGRWSAGRLPRAIGGHWIFWINAPVGVAAAWRRCGCCRRATGPAERLDLAGVGLVTGGVVGDRLGRWSAPARPGGPARRSSPRSASAASCWPPSSPGRSACPSRWFRCGCSAAARSRSATPPPSSCRARSSRAPTSSPRNSSSRGTTHRPSTGLRLLPFFGMPMIISPLAGALSDKTGRLPVMVTGLALLTPASPGSRSGARWRPAGRAPRLALLVSGIGISMALPTAPTAVLSAVAPDEMGKAAGINYMAQRLGGVFAIANLDRRVLRQREPRHAGQRHQRVQAGPRRLRRVRPARHPQRASDHIAHG